MTMKAEQDTDGNPICAIDRAVLTMHGVMLSTTWWTCPHCRRLYSFMAD
jgi:hypothetical protein